MKNVKLFFVSVLFAAMPALAETAPNLTTADSSASSSASIAQDPQNCKTVHPTCSTSTNSSIDKPIKKPKPKAPPVYIAPSTFDFAFTGDIQESLNALQYKQPQLTILSPDGTPTPITVHVDLHNTTLVDALRVIGEQGGNLANVTYNGANRSARISFKTKNNMGTDSSIEAKRWQAGGNARPVMGTDGLLMYPFGQSQPELTCAPLRACDIQLQSGEVINNVIIGDTVRWIPAPAKTGDGAMATPHVIIKPTESGLETNLVITTSLRTYILTLKSSDVNYVSRVGFYYPADMVQDWNGQAELDKRRADEDAKRKVSDLPVASIDQINLDAYKIKGNKRLSWYPTRVFDDGIRVWIQMPASIRSSEAPALVLLDKKGNSELVNYRVKEAEQGGNKVTYYIVDKIFDHAGLIVGVGRDQKKIEIIKTSTH